MSEKWDSNQYLKFEDQRNQPAIDLLNRLAGFQPEAIADLGCGPGNSTMLLKKTFPRAEILGIDSSEDMISKAQREHGEVNFIKNDIRELQGQYDLLFSNACLQWVPDHQTLFPFLLTHLKPGGIFAAQFPMNDSEPLYQLIYELAGEERWGLKGVTLDYNGSLMPHEYFDLLSPLCKSVQIWETKYYHNLNNHQALIEWVKGTRIRPYLAHLSPLDGDAFEQELLKRVQMKYPIMDNGEVILHFNRFFILGIR